MKHKQKEENNRTSFKKVCTEEGGVHYTEERLSINLIVITYKKVEILLSQKMKLSPVQFPLRIKRALQSLMRARKGSGNREGNPIRFGERGKELFNSIFLDL